MWKIQKAGALCCEMEWSNTDNLIRNGFVLEEQITVWQKFLPSVPKNPMSYGLLIDESWTSFPVYVTYAGSRNAEFAWQIRLQCFVNQGSWRKKSRGYSWYSLNAKHTESNKGVVWYMYYIGKLCLWNLLPMSLHGFLSYRFYVGHELLPKLLRH